MRVSASVTASAFAVMIGGCSSSSDSPESYRYVSIIFEMTGTDATIRDVHVYWDGALIGEDALSNITVASATITKRSTIIPAHIRSQ